MPLAVNDEDLVMRPRPEVVLLPCYRERLRDMERQHDKDVAAEKERARQVKADITAVDEAEDDLPAWQRRPVSTRYATVCLMLIEMEERENAQCLRAAKQT